MKTRIIAVAIVCACAWLMHSSAAEAQPVPMVFTWTGNNLTSDWGDTANWKPTSPPGGPGAGQVAVIPRVDTTVVSNPVLALNRTVGWIRIEAGGELTTDAYTLSITKPGGLALDSGGVLTVSDGGKVTISPVNTPGREDRHVIGGTIFLEGPGSGTDAAILDMGLGFRTVLAGGGRIVGEHADALITITKRLRSEIIIEGALTIRSTVDLRQGIFENFGLVHAAEVVDGVPSTVPGDIKLDWLAEVTGPGEWRVGSPEPSPDDGATLTFKPNIGLTLHSPPLSGDFKLFGNKLAIQSTIATSGRLHYHKGTITVAAGKEFRAN